MGIIRAKEASEVRPPHRQVGHVVALASQGALHPLDLSQDLVCVLLGPRWVQIVKKQEGEFRADVSL
jgi:hypothetical protein